QRRAESRRATARLGAARRQSRGRLGWPYQVDQLRQSVETNRAGLLQAKTTLTNQLENFKVNVLCIPSDTPIALDEEFIKPFQFISPDLQSLQNDLGDFLAENSVGAEEDLKETEDPRIDDDDQSAERLPAPANESGRTNAAGDERDAAGADAAGAAATDGGPVRADEATEEAEDEAALELVQRSLARLAELRERVETQVAEVEEDLRRTGSASEARLAGMRPTERETFNREMRLLKDDLAKLLVRTREYEAEMEKLAAGMTKATLRQTADRFVKLVTDISSAVDEMSLIQARARVEAITIDFDPIDPDEAFEIARANRLDWMNNRAALVDQWRLIQFNAMALLSGLDVVVDGGINTVGNNPAKFRAPTGAISAGLQFDAPFTRLTERNNFRQAILDYQQVRRQQIQYEDRIKLAIRQALRQLDLDKQNLETQRRAVIIAIRRVDQTRLNLAQPAPPPPMPGPDGTSPPIDPTAGQLGPTATLNLIFAFNDLRSSQDALTSIWINYYATRASLAQQLGVMQLTDDGLWIESSLDCVERAADDEMPLPPPVPQEWLDHLEEVKAPPPRPAAADGKNPAPGNADPANAAPGNAPVAPIPLPGPANDGADSAGAAEPLLVPVPQPSPPAAPESSAGGWTTLIPRIPGFKAPSPAGK
ncbi:MAG: TolC family protein, partial [Planctomycetaceae bacterium]